MEDIEFLLQYAKVGILKTMEDLDQIASEELKQEYIRIKNDLKKKKPVQKLPTFESSHDEKKPGAIRRWFSGIGDRQRKYQELHKDEVL